MEKEICKKPSAQMTLRAHKKTPAALLSSGQGYRGYSAGQAKFFTSSVQPQIHCGCGLTVSSDC